MINDYEELPLYYRCIQLGWSVQYDDTYREASVISFYPCVYFFVSQISPYSNIFPLPHGTDAGRYTDVEAQKTQNRWHRMGWLLRETWEKTTNVQSSAQNKHWTQTLWAAFALSTHICQRIMKIEGNNSRRKSSNQQIRTQFTWLRKGCYSTWVGANTQYASLSRYDMIYNGIWHFCIVQPYN